MKLPEATPLVVKRFKDIPPPSPREFVVGKLVPKGHATSFHGDGGSAKSILVLSMLQAVAAGGTGWLCFPILEQMPTLYVDFELDEAEQTRRALQIAYAEGRKDLPDDFFYLCGAGRPHSEVFATAYQACTEYDIGLMAIDSVGLALVGDAGNARDVISFHTDCVDRFRANLGVTVVLVDHQSRVQLGESYQNKGAFGSAYKNNLVRSRVQVELKDRGQAARGVVLRQMKANFSSEAEPFKVRVEFFEDEIRVCREELPPEELVEERVLNLKDRVLVALMDSPKWPSELCEELEVANGPLSNATRSLRRDGFIERTGEHQGNAWELRITDSGRERVRRYLEARPTSQLHPLHKEHEVVKSETVGEGTGESSLLWEADVFEADDVGAV